MRVAFEVGNIADCKWISMQFKWTHESPRGSHMPLMFSTQLSSRSRCPNVASFTDTRFPRGVHICLCSARDQRPNSHEPKMASILVTCVRENIIAELAGSEELRGISKALKLQHLAIPARTLEKRVLEYSLQMKLASDWWRNFIQIWNIFSTKASSLAFLGLPFGP